MCLQMIKFVFEIYLRTCMYICTFISIRLFQHYIIYSFISLLIYLLQEAFKLRLGKSTEMN